MRKAIEILKESLRATLIHRAEGFPMYAHEPERSIRQALALLEAATKMKKKIDQDFLVGCWDETYGDFNKRSWRRIFALLESLPDKPEKEKP